MDLVASLVDKSVLFRDPDEEVAHYRMLDTIREYGAARLLEEGGPARWEERQTLVGMERVREIAERWMGPDQDELVRLARRNHDNLRGVLQRTCATPDQAATGLTMVVRLEHYWVMTGRISEGVHWLTTGLRHEGADPALRARAHAVASYLSSLQADLGTAARHLDEARALGAGLDDVGVEGYLAFADAGLALFDGRPERAVETSAGWLRRAHAGCHLQIESMLLLAQGLALSALGRLDEAVEVNQRLAQRTGAVGERFLHSMALWSLSLDLRERGDLDAADAHATRALELKRPIGDEVGVALCLESLAATASVRRDPARSATLLGAAERLWRRIGVTALSAPYIAAQRELGERLARGSLRDQLFEDAYRCGQAMSTAEAVRWALTADRAVADDPLDGTRLTRREREIALLIGEGLTNQQIADRLVISVRTAQGHVEKILRKLELASRTQVATWVVSRRA